MGERTSDATRRILGLAQRHAVQLQHPWIGSVHLLLALLEERRGLAGRALREQGLSLETATQAVRALTPPEATVDEGRQLYPTSDGQQVLDGAQTVADQPDSDQVETEHLLLSLLADTSSAASNVLMALGADAAALQAATLVLIAEGPSVVREEVDAGSLLGRAALASLTAARDTLRVLAADHGHLDALAQRVAEAVDDLDDALPG